MQTYYSLLEKLRGTPSIVSRWLLPSYGDDGSNIPEKYRGPIAECVGRWRDLEMEVYTLRLARLIHEKHPKLPVVDVSSLFKGKNYSTQSIKINVDFLTALRNGNADLLRTLHNEEDWQRTGCIGSGDVLTIEEFVGRWLAHDKTYLLALISLLPAPPYIYDLPRDWRIEFEEHSLLSKREGAHQTLASSIPEKRAEVSGERRNQQSRESLVKTEWI